MKEYYDQYVLQSALSKPGSFPSFWRVSCLHLALNFLLLRILLLLLLVMLFLIVVVQERFHKFKRGAFVVVVVVAVLLLLLLVAATMLGIVWLQKKTQFASKMIVGQNFSNRTIVFPTEKIESRQMHSLPGFIFCRVGWSLGVGCHVLLLGSLGVDWPVFGDEVWVWESLPKRKNEIWCFSFFLSSRGLEARRCRALSFCLLC